MVNDPVSYNKSINTELKSIVKPFLEHFRFDNFIYIKLQEKKRLYLSTNTAWVEKYVEHKFFDDVHHEQSVIRPLAKPKFAFWDGFEKDNIFDAARTVDLWHGFIMYDGNEIFAFTTYQDDEYQVNKCTANIALFDHFILYFRDAAKDMTTPHKSALLTSTNQDEAHHASIKDEICNLRASMPITDFYLYDNAGNEYKITRREAQTLQLLAKGRTFAEAAFYLGISPKTFEKYVENLKLKLNSYCKSKLIDIYQQTNLRDVVLCN